MILSSRQGLPLISAVGGLALVAAPLHAQEPIELEPVAVEGRQQNMIGEAVSASQGLIGQAEIQRRPLLRTSELLETIPGLVVTQHSGTGKSAQMFLRGFNLDHGTDFATFVDGMPVNMRTHGHGQGYTDLNFIIPELVRTIEFNKGSYYTEVGDFSGAGSAHLRTVDSLSEGTVKYGAGEYGFQRLFAADSFELGGNELLLGGLAHIYDGAWDDVDEDVTRLSALARYSGRSGSADWSVSFMGYDAEWDSADQIPQRAVTSGLISELGSLDTTVGGESSRYSLSGSWTVADADRETRISAYAIDYELDLYSNFTYFLDDPVDGDQFEQVDDRLILGGEVARSWLNTGARNNLTHTVGLQLRHDDIDEVGLFQSRERVRLDPVRVDSVRETSYSAFYENEADWTGRLRTVAGVRVDYFDFDVDALTLPENSGSESDTIVSPKVNVIYSASDALELYLSAGQGFHSNDARGTTISIDPTDGSQATPVDPLVESEGAEVGFRFFFQEKLNSSVALWYLDLDSELLFVGDAGNTEASGASRRYGVEFANYYRPNDVWTFDLDLSLTDAEFKNDEGAGTEIPGSLDRVLSLGASARWPSGFFGSLRLRHFGERPLIEDGSVESGDSSVVNLQAGYERDRLRFELQVLNLFDSNDQDIAYFYASRLPGEPEEGVEDVHFHPIEPRMVRAFVEWRF